MLARRQIPERYLAFNGAWGAPLGRPALRRSRWLGERSRFGIRERGPFAWQPNNTTRAFEFPWAHETVTALGGAQTVAEIGGGMSGLQFVLAKAGHRVLNVDPGLEARGRGWELNASFHRRLQEVFEAPVDLRAATIAEAGIPDSSVDVLLSVSTIEHFSREDLDELIGHARRVLRPGGRAVLTIDLFLDLVPFTRQERNEWGTNVDIRALLEAAGLELESGEPEELYGFESFDPESVQSRLTELLTGSYASLVQCIVARAPNTQAADGAVRS
jgi:SAM-dependent methyltransferase